MQLVFAPLWGRLSDAHGRRPILVATILGQGASLLVLGFAPSLAWLFVGRALAGICGANLSTAAAYIADVTPEEGRARGMGVIGAGFGLGFIFGPAIGGLLSHWGYGTPMFVAAGVALTAGLFAWARLPEPPLDPRCGSSTGRSFDRAAIRESLGDGRTRIAILLFFVLTLAATQTETAFALFLESRRGYGAREAGLLLGFTGLVMAGVQGGLIGPLSRRFGEARLVALGALALGGALVVFASTSQLRARSSPRSRFLGFGMGLTHPSLQSLASLGALPGRQGATMGVYQSAGSLARIAGPPFAGFLYDVYGGAVPFLAAAALSIRGLRRRADVAGGRLRPRGHADLPAGRLSGHARALRLQAVRRLRPLLPGPRRDALHRPALPRGARSPLALALRYRLPVSRIIGGAGKGRRLKTAAGDATRPTGARVRQSLFDILAPAHPGLPLPRRLRRQRRRRARGALARRGAGRARGSERRCRGGGARERAGAGAARAGEVQVFRQEARTALEALADAGRQFDVVFLDPPYESDLYEPLLELAGERLLAEGGVVVAEHFHKRALPERIGALIRTRTEARRATTA